MPRNDTPINEFQNILFHNLGLHERHRLKTDTFESEEINNLYKAFQEYQKNPSTESLATVKSNLKVCESFNKDLPYKQLHNLIEQLATTHNRVAHNNAKRNSPR